MCYLISLLEADDDSGCDDSFDILQEKETPFKQIFMENINFKVNFFSLETLISLRINRNKLLYD